MQLDHLTFCSPWKNQSELRPAALSELFTQSGLADLARRLTAVGLKGETLTKAIKAETQPEVFFHQLFILGCELENRNAGADALQLFSALLSADPKRYPISPGLREKITERTQALQGQGKGAFESLGRKLIQESTAPEMILGMTGASLLGRTASAVLLSRLSTQPGLSPFLAKAIAGTGALLVEAPTLTFLNRGAANLRGKRPEASFSDALQASFFMLGAYKLSGGISRQALQPLGKMIGTGPVGNGVSAIFQQAASFGSILGGQELLSHWQTGSGPQHRLRDAALFWLQAQIGNHLSCKLVGPRAYAALAEAENMTRRPSNAWSISERLAKPALASASSGGVDWHAPMLMSSQPPKLIGMPWLESPPAKVSIEVKNTSPLSRSKPALDPLKLEKLLELARDIDPSLTKVEALTRLSGEYHQIARSKAAKSLLGEAEAVASNLPLAPERVIAWGRIGLAYQATGKPNGAATFFERAFAEADQLPLRILRPELLDGFDGLLCWLAEMQNEHPMPYLARAMRFGLEAQAVAFPGRGEPELMHQVATRVAKLGNHELSLRLAQEIDSDLSFETQVRIARHMVEHGERNSAKSLLRLIDGAVDVDLLRADLALDYLKTFQPEKFRDIYARIQHPFHKMDVLLRAAEMSRAQGKYIQAIEWVEEAQWRFRHEKIELNDAQRAMLRIKLANLNHKHGQDERRNLHLEAVHAELPRFIRLSHPLSSEFIPIFAEYLMTIHEVKGESSAYMWLPQLLEADRFAVQRQVALRFGEKGMVPHAQVWAGDIEVARRSDAQADLAKTLFRAGLTEDAFELAKRIVDPAASFDALLWLYSASSREIPTPGTPPPSDPPPASGTDGSNPGKSFSSAAAIPVNARSLGNDTRAALPKPLGEPTRELVDAVPWHFFATKRSKDPEPQYLHLALPDASLTPTTPSTIPVIQFASDPSSPKGKPISDPPPAITDFKAESQDWVKRVGLDHAQVKLVENFLDSVYRYVWWVLNYQSGTRLAHRLASGKAVTLRIIPQNQGLRDYALEMLDSDDVPQEKYNMVQLRFQPDTGKLSPMPYAEHDEYEQSAIAMGVDIRNFFIPVYRRIDLTSPALRASKLIQHLPEPVQHMLVDDPTIQRPVEAAKRPHQKNPDSLIVNYRPLIFEATKREVEEYAQSQKMPDEGKRRLHKLTQHILAVLFERESKLTEPENVALKVSNGIYAVVRMDANVPGQMNIEVMTAKQLAKNQKSIKNDAVVLFVLRYTPMGGEDEDYSHLEHHYRGTNQTPTPADLAFQKYLGLNERLHMLWEVMDIRPNEMTLKKWDAWMVEHGYFEETVVDLFPPRMK